MLRRSFASLAFVLLAHLPTGPLAGQVGGPLQPPTTGGLPALLQELRMLGHQKRVLMIGAHPDDEDSELLVLLTRREGAETGYLSLTRGEGGQNLIGNELGEALGILRTEELMAARNIDGAQQFFTRAYDFGFSKTIEDTWAHWPRDSVLKDVVRIIRRFRPQIVVSVFRGGPLDGHGQHQAAGWAAQEAFRIAADPTRFPELASEEGLQPFSPTKLYRSARFDPDGRTVNVDGGEVERLSGKTYHQLAMLSRSQHRSQDMGRLQDFGPSIGGVERLLPAGRDSGEGWAAFWSGVDTTLGLPRDYVDAVSKARTAAGRDRASVVSALTEAYYISDPYLVHYRGESGYSTVVAEQRSHIENARAIASWVFLDAIADVRHVAIGDSLSIQVRARNAGDQTQEGLLWWVDLGGGAGMSRSQRDDLWLPAGGAVARRATVIVPDSVRPTSPDYLRTPRIAGTYSWAHVGRLDKGSARGSPEPGAYLSRHDPGRLHLISLLRIRTPVALQVRDQAFGEVRRPVTIVPRVGVKVARPVAVIRGANGDRTTTIDVEVEHFAVGATIGEVKLELPAGWIAPRPVPFSFTGGSATRRVAFTVAAPSSFRSGSVDARAVAIDQEGRRYDLGVFLVNYPHIRERQYTKPATVRIEVIDLHLPLARRVGYVRGAADRIPEALEAAGLQVT
ncbi:MAG: PIG-L family deacetylase, partial [Actinomycetota bacterium]|nr:PIG-L family deacetylase [Actinomycetota bacterium]